MHYIIEVSVMRDFKGTKKLSPTSAGSSRSIQEMPTHISIGDAASIQSGNLIKLYQTIVLP